jgi:hypothetical protein
METTSWASCFPNDFDRFYNVTGKRAGKYEYAGGHWSRARLTSIDIPADVTSIEAGAFTGMELESVTIPPSVTTIGEKAFDGNPLTRITIGDNVNLEPLSLPDGFVKSYNSNGKQAGTYRQGIFLIWKKID